MMSCEPLSYTFLPTQVGILRVSRECEIVGLDSYKHDDEAYPECT